MKNEKIEIKKHTVIIQYEDIQDTNGVKEIPITYNIKGGNIIELVPIHWKDKDDSQKLKHITNRIEQRLEHIYRNKFKKI